MKVIDRQSIDGEVFYLVRLTATELKPMFGDDDDTDPDGLQPQDVVCVDVRGLMRMSYDKGYMDSCGIADGITSTRVYRDGYWVPFEERSRADDEECRPRLATPVGPPGTTYRVVNCTKAELESITNGPPVNGTE